MPLNEYHLSMWRRLRGHLSLRLSTSTSISFLLVTHPHVWPVESAHQCASAFSVPGTTMRGLQVADTTNNQSTDVSDRDRFPFFLCACNNKFVSIAVLPSSDWVVVDATRPPCLAGRCWNRNHGRQRTLVDALTILALTLPWLQHSD